MSTWPVTTGMPEALMRTTGDFTKLRMMSMSWIMRSSTTLTSVPRFLKMPSRWDSMNMGRFTRPFKATTAGLNRSRCPTWRISPPALASWIRSSA